MKELIVVGNGKLADVIKEEFSSYSAIPVKSYKTGLTANNESVFLHIGSGRQYSESLERAMESGASYIQAATEKDINMEAPEDNRIRYINAPNLDLNIIKLFYWLETAGDLFAGEPISVTESHQKEKSSLPGTAVKFCEKLNVPPESLVSIRDPEKQKALQIQNLNHHAFHRILIGDENSKIVIETKIEGADSYAKGVAGIIKALSSLEKGNYEIDDLVKLKLL